MTQQRKTLLAIAAMLLCANAVALAVMSVKPAPTPDLWFGMRSVEISDLIPHGTSQTESQILVILNRDGAFQNGQPAPFAAMIDNVGVSQFSEGRAGSSCFYGCVQSPWRAVAMARDDTPMSVVLSAIREIAQACDVEVYIASEFANLDSRMSGGAFPILASPLTTQEVADFGRIHPISPDHVALRPDETLAAFGERTGCARISPLRP